MLVRLVIALAVTGIAAGRFPMLRMNRATIALVGAVLVTVLGGLSLEGAFAALDLGTLALVFSMMVISINLRLSGFFSLVGLGITRVAHTPGRLLGLVIAASGVLSALFLNDTIVLMFTPLVTAVALDLDRDPVPYLVGQATAANIGSAATLIGNPQNMLIGAASGIDFFRFLVVLAPPSAAGLLAAWVVVRLVFRKEFDGARFDPPGEGRRRVYRPLLVKSLLATGLLFGGIAAGAPLVLASLCAAALLLVTRRVKPQRVFAELDWSLLVLFAGLFVVTDALRNDPGFRRFLEGFAAAAGRDPGFFSLVSAALSNLVSNVPAVMLLRPVAAVMPDPERAWITLAMATTYAGNFTLLGSIANLIVAESAARHGVRLGFRAYFTAGAPITIITIIMGSLWLGWVY